MSYARVQPMLPLSIEDLVGLDPPDEVQTRIQMTGSVRRIPSANAIVRSSVKAMPPLPPVRPVRSLREARQSPTVATFRTRAARKMAWPVFLCGFIAGISGGTAVLKSPAGQRPLVQHVVKKASLVVHGIVR